MHDPRLLPIGTRGLAMSGVSEGIFYEPEVFDVARAKPWHVGFGHGLHFCLGAALARLEAQEALRVVTERVRRLELVDGPPTFVPFAAIRRFERLRLAVRILR